MTIMGNDNVGLPIIENVRVGGVDLANSRITLATGPSGATVFQTFSGAMLVHTSTGGRVAGKINLNTAFDKETFQALCDQNSANNFTVDDPNNIFANLSAAIHVGTSMTAPWSNPSSDQPFYGMGMAQLQAPPLGTDLLQLTSRNGISRSFFRPVSDTNPTGMLEPAGGGSGSHPYLRYELLNKVYNNLTSRSNVFAVWLTVGFFECDVNGNNLGQEVGKSEGKNVRHRMFAIVDRTGLAVPRLVGTLDQPDTEKAPPPYLPYATGKPVNLVLEGGLANSTSGVSVGSQLLVGNPGSNMEAVTVQVVTANRITVTFIRSHSPKESVYIAPGNWGPQPGFDVTQPVNRELVPYYSIIE
jgi:hypothetical protein